MIELTRLNHVAVIVNSDLIEHIEITPDTVITLTSGQKMVVLETAAQVMERVVAFRRSILDGIMLCQAVKPNESCAAPAAEST